MSISQKIDEICDPFEAAWKAGEQPSLQAAIESIARKCRGALAKDLMPLDVKCRAQFATIPDASDYAVFGGSSVQVSQGSC